MSTHTTATAKCHWPALRRNFSEMRSLTDDAYKLFERRTYDCTATTGDKVKVYFNGTLLSVKNFDKYAGLYLSDDAKRAHETSPDGRWDVIVSTSDHSFRQVSFQCWWILECGQRFNPI